MFRLLLYYIVNILYNNNKKENIVIKIDVSNTPCCSPIRNNTTDTQSIHNLQNEVFKQMRIYVNNQGLKMDIYSAEKHIFSCLQQMGLLLLQELIANHDGGKADEVINEHGTALPYHSMKKITYISFFGKLEFERSYYWCIGEDGFCPLDAKLNMPENRYSYYLSEWVQDSVADGAYDKAIQRYSNLLNVPLSKLCQENITQKAGASFDDFYRQKDTSSFKEEGSTICIQADCKGVRMIPSEKPETSPVTTQGPRLGKGQKRGLKRDSVVTVDYTFDPVIRTPIQMIELLMRENKDKNNTNIKFVRNPQVAASMDGKSVAFDRLAERIKMRDPCGTKDIVILVDGEPALEMRLHMMMEQMAFTTRIRATILDIIHVMEYVWKAATALYGENSNQRVKWVRKQGLAILEGRVGRVIGAIKQIITKQNGTLVEAVQETLERVIKYFTNHKHMMQYDQYLAKGYQIATGMAEGACGSLVKDRAEISGARWSKKGVQAVLNLRAVKKNNDWNNFWHFHMNHKKIELYGNFKFASN